MRTIVGNIPGSLGGLRLLPVTSEDACVGVFGLGEDAGDEGRRSDAMEDDWTERRVLVISKGYVTTTEVIPAIAPAVNRRGVVNSVAPFGINN
jgi:hypothetical protein